MRMYFNEYMSTHQIQAHMSVMDGDKAVELPIVNGVIKIPDALHDKVVLQPGWVPYTGRSQASVNPEELTPLEDVNKFYGVAKSTRGSRSNTGNGDGKTQDDNGKQEDESQAK